MLLSTYRRRRYKSDPGGRRSARGNAGTNTENATLPGVVNGTEPRPKKAAGEQPPPPTTARRSNAGNAHNRSSVPESQSEFDEYGTELHPDARVWKVYVQEADKYDEELVKGWNDSTDVILIFAALFSAISTAFLIESSKMLQPDPADVSAQTLATISQTLLTLANGTQPSGSLTSPADPAADFVPSRTAIYVNMLWYLSLSLSLATSFIAILSKDWCHAFMSGRTGHHYAQTCRRQQKWDMLERWKMSELLAVLPSLIHMALLLFSVGLCILLWDIHSIIALPVVCISGLAFGFYVWSSATAIVLDFFPYPTIISKLCRTGPVQLAYQVAVQSPRQFSWLLVYAVVRPLKYLFDRLYSLSDRLSDHSSSRWRNALVEPPALWVWRRMHRGPWPQLNAEQWVGRWFARPDWRLDPTSRESKALSRGGFRNSAESMVKGMALSWLIKNCENPQSVDTALQSIAGATNRVAPQPLLECQAPLQILRRLASSNLYRRLDTKSKTVEVLYLRALSFLRGSTNSSSENYTNNGSESEALVWDLQMEIEKKLATLIEKGDFDPTQNNLEALRIGSTVASRSLKILRNDLEGADLKGIFDSIIGLLRSHLGQAAKLHSVALLSLTHAATLLTLVAPATATASRDDTDPLPALPVSPAPTKEATEEATDEATEGRDTESNLNDMLTLPSLLLQLTTDLHQPKLVTGLAATTAIFYDLREEQTQRGQPDNTTWTEEILRGLVERYAEGEITSGWIANIKSPSIATAEQDDSTKYISQLERNFLSEYKPSTLPTVPTSEVPPVEQDSQTLREGFVLAKLYALAAIHSLQPVTAPSPAIYVIFVEIMCRTPPSSPLFACGAQMLSKCPFPTLSEELATALEQRDLVPLLETTSTSDNLTKRYFARGQLWLLLSLYIYAGDTASGRDKLKVQLDKCRGNGSKSEEGRHRGLGRLLLTLVNPNSTLARELGVWACRLQECVRQFCERSQRRDMEDSLRDILPELRGLPSFTAWPRQADHPSANEPQPAEEVAGEARERTDAINVRTEGEGATGHDGHLQSAGLVADTGEAETQGEDDAGQADSSQDLEATTQGPPAGDGKSLTDVNSREEVGKVRGEGNSGVEAVSDERRVADAGDTTEATDELQSEDEEAESEDLTQGGGNEGDVVIRMGRL